jgi:UDP-N-acetylglucosamine 1-carboxyvinyltransferase
MRASILALGPLVARFGEARISLPGGCAIGARPVDMHLSALKKLGAEIDISEGFIVARARKLRGAHIHFRRKTVTGTENLMMAAVLADGTTVLENAAQEPEIVDLAICLRSMGARVFGEGTKEIVIEGVASLKGARHEVCGDRIEAGTFMCAAMATHGSIHVRGINPETMTNLLAKVTLTGCRIESDRGVLHVKTPKVLQPVDIATAPYPGFPTDMQAQWMAAMLFADGDTRITEKVFENRFLHVAELRRMGAEIIEEDSHTCTIKGLARPLSGAPVMATDLRASASLVIAALAARGVTTVDRIYHLDRGYERFEKKLSELGAKIARVRV